jgi:hypothetical protein
VKHALSFPHPGQDVFISIQFSNPDRPQRAKAVDSDLIVSIPLHQHKGRSLSQVREFLDEHDAGTQLKKMPTGQFFLNVGVGADGGTIHPSIRFLKNLPKVRLLMHLYRFWLKHPELDKEKRLSDERHRSIAHSNAALEFSHEPPITVHAEDDRPSRPSRCGYAAAVV